MATFFDGHRLGYFPEGDLKKHSLSLDQADLFKIQIRVFDETKSGGAGGGIKLILGRRSLDLTLACRSLELSLACRRPLCPERPNLVRHCASGKNPCFFPLALLLFLPRPSDERCLLDFIFGVFTLARIRGGTKGRRRPKHLAMTGDCIVLFWSTLR